jgi:elongation factor G
MQVPIGAEEHFQGVIDLVKMKAIAWDEASQGMKFEYVDIPADLIETCNEWRAKLVETAAEATEELMMKYLEDGELTEEEIKAAIRKGTLAVELFPVLCGSAYKDKGVQPMLDAVIDFLPAPTDIPSIKGTDEDGNEVERHASDDEPFSALAFKIMADPFVGKLSFFRVYSGQLPAGSYIYNTRTEKKERISRIFQMHSNKQNPVELISAGDIGAGVGFKDIRTGDTLCDEAHPITLESMDFPAPVIGISIEPKTQKDLDKLGLGLSKLAEEDPTFTVKTDEASGQTIISGMGELHLDILIDRMKREFKVEVNQGEPQVEYKEAFTKAAQHREVYKKQSGGRGKFGDIVFRLEPADLVDGKAPMGLQFVNEVKGGNVPKEYIPAVEKGFREAMKTGPLAGYQVDSLKVTLLDGSFHPVDSDALSFELAAKMGYKEVAKAAGAVILEPIMKIEVITPEENMGDIVGDLNRRRGQVNDMGDRNGAKTIKANVPLSEMFGYVTTLRTLSSGRATSTMEFSHYEETPSNISEAVIKKAKGNA